MTAPTVAAWLTAPGASAVASIGVRGPDAWRIAHKYFQRLKAKGAKNSDQPASFLPELPRAGRIYFGRFGTDWYDEVVLAVRAHEPMVEIDIHGHGSVTLVRHLLDLLRSENVQILSWTYYARESGTPEWKTDLLQHLSQAPTLRCANHLLSQYSGAWEAEIAAIRAALAKANVAEAHQRFGQLKKRLSIGTHLVDPWTVVLGGAPNVGKSSLVNALAGYVRSVVSPLPGTTRDAVGVRLAIEGWPVELIDTAGLRAGSDDLEREGMERARRAADEADLRLWIVDGSASPQAPPNESWQIVINKIDLPAGWDWAIHPKAIKVSAQTGAGITELCHSIAQLLIPNPPQDGEAIPWSIEALNSVDQILKASGVA